MGTQGAPAVPQASQAQQEEAAAAVAKGLEQEDSREANPAQREGAGGDGAKPGLAAIFQLLAGILSLTQPSGHPVTDPNPGSSPGSAGDLINDPYPCQNTSAWSESGSQASSPADEAQGRVPLGSPHHPTTLRPSVNHKESVFHGCPEATSRTDGPSVILDIGATHDLIGREQAPSATRVRTLTRPIRLFTAGGERLVSRVGDVTLRGALCFTQAMLAPWSRLSLVSLPTRLTQGWSSGRRACLVSPSGKNHHFTLSEGLFRHDPGHALDPEGTVAMPAEGGSQGATDTAEGVSEGATGTAHPAGTAGARSSTPSGAGSETTPSMQQPKGVQQGAQKDVKQGAKGPG